MPHHDNSSEAATGIGTHSRLAIGLWAKHKGMVKSAVEPKSDRRVQDALRAGSIKPNLRE
jgi:hypothetical protein